MGIIRGPFLRHCGVDITQRNKISKLGFFENVIDVNDNLIF